MPPGCIGRLAAGSSGGPTTLKVVVGVSSLITCLTQQIMAYITRGGPPMRSALQCLGRCGRRDDQLVNNEMYVYLDMTSRSGVGPDKDCIKWTTSNISRCKRERVHTPPKSTRMHALP